ncbi:hypothetical protein N9J26_01555 [bacterium]|nr:hypothetical protein [bacterium]
MAVFTDCWRLNRFVRGVLVLFLLTGCSPNDEATEAFKQNFVIACTDQNTKVDARFECACVANKLIERFSIEALNASDNAYIEHYGEVFAEGECHHPSKDELVK